MDGWMIDKINVNNNNERISHDYFCPQFEMFLTFSFKKKIVTYDTVRLFIANSL